MNSFTQFAETAGAEAGQGNLFTALGIDVQLLFSRSSHLCILVFLLSKFVFPILFKAVDDRKEKIDEAGKAAVEAEKKAEAAEAKVEDALKDARKQAAEIVATAKDEAIAMVEKAENSAKTKAQNESLRKLAKSSQKM